MGLESKKCVPCEGGIAKIKGDEVDRLLKDLPGWKAKDDKLARTFHFKDFLGAMAFVDRMAILAESEGHHPDFTVHYNIVEVSLWTHAIGGLSENDFILAAKINEFEV